MILVVATSIFDLLTKIEHFKSLLLRSDSCLWAVLVVVLIGVAANLSLLVAAVLDVLRSSRPLWLKCLLVVLLVPGAGVFGAIYFWKIWRTPSTQDAI